MADIGDVQRKLGSLIHQDGSCRLDQMPMVAATLAHDQALGSAYAARRSLQRNWLVQNEIGAHLKGLLDVGLAIYHGEGDAALVGLALPQLPENEGPMGHVVAIDQKGVIFAAKKNVAGLVGVVGEIQIDICGIQDSTYRTMDFRVIAEEERL